jgi:hypothetical protein
LLRHLHARMNDFLWSVFGFFFSLSTLVGLLHVETAAEKTSPKYKYCALFFAEQRKAMVHSFAEDDMLFSDAEGKNDYDWYFLSSNFFFLSLRSYLIRWSYKHMHNMCIFWAPLFSLRSRLICWSYIHMHCICVFWAPLRFPEKLFNLLMLTHRCVAYAYFELHCFLWGAI